ncbi:hypothetical protein PIB30_072026 [Stylosanthes scabra]|uniref:Uncharacterized protein n=1 Tax=Stylosanthes scabra TaxID=79078 RepID=A0ABU6ZML5_9FABA|nr:hypothetical protein [Stylosanthes scabra]
MDAVNGNEPRRTLGDYTIPSTASCGSSIVRPNVEANNFELKPSLIQLWYYLIQYTCRIVANRKDLPHQCYGRSVTQTDLQKHAEISALKHKHQEEVTTLRTELGDVKTKQQ